LENTQILIADDEPFIVRSLAFILRREGLETAVARDGEETVEKARALRPRILFLDIMMPKRNGFEICRLIKDDPTTRPIYVIMLTAKGQEEDKRKSLLAGADEYITKPFSPRQVITRVREILDRPS
jgi:DNA-binding response OmpR family regulator